MGTEDKKNKGFTVGLVSITVNAVGPMNEYISKNEPDIKTVNYLDGYLMEKIKKENGITPESMTRFIEMIGKAFRDGADGVITTCTVFTPYVEYFSQIFKKPVVAADAAMLDNVSKLSGKTAIICTFDGTVDTTRNAYFSYRKKNGMPEEVDMYTVPDAFEAAQKGDTQKCNQIVAEKVKTLDGQYDQIILAQISMSGAIELFSPESSRIFTSPSESVNELKSRLFR